MARYIIEGNREVSGEITPSGNKNEALPALVSCLLTHKPVVLRNVPRIRDVLTMCDLLKDLGVSCEWQGSILALDAAKAQPYGLLEEKCKHVRAAILFLGSLLARFGKVRLPLPGGDVIGARKIDTHFDGFRALGVRMEFGSVISGELPSPAKGNHIFLDEPSVTATENILYLAVLASGVTEMENVACEPHVVGLCRLLNQMGAKIHGVGSNRLRIEGVSSLKGADHTIGSDFMEVASYVSLGASCGGKLRINNVRLEDYHGIMRHWKKLGIVPKCGEDHMEVDGSLPRRMERDISGRIATIYSAPWPGFPTDLMSVAIVAATQASGNILFFEKMFEGRMFFTDKLLNMGAQIVLCDPHRVVVTGKSPLVAARMSSPDVRAGMALVIAACIAKGVSEIDNIYQVERGYTQVVEKLSQIGVAITLVDS